MASVFLGMQLGFCVIKHRKLRTFFIWVWESEMCCSCLWNFHGADEGGSPVWNETFTFRAEYPGSGDDFKLVLKIMDHDNLSADDFIGQTS